MLCCSRKSFAAALLAAALCTQLAAQQSTTSSDTLILDPISTEPLGVTTVMAEPVNRVTVESASVSTSQAAEIESRLETVLDSIVGERAEGLPDLLEFERYVRDKSKSELAIDLNEVVIRTVCKNLNIRLADIANRQAHDEIHAQEGIFDLNVSGKVEANQTVTPLPIDFDSAPDGTDRPNRASRDRQFAAALGLSQLMPTGAVVDLLFENNKNYTDSTFGAFDAFSPNYGMRAGITGRQPLLRDGGPLVTQAGILQAQYSNLITNQQLRLQVLDEVAQAMGTYYDLIFAIANVDVLRIALAQAEELRRVNSEKFNAGTLPELDVLQAEADVASRQGILIEALQNVESVSDRLKIRLAEICELREVALRPTELPTVPTYTIDEKRFLAEAVCYRPEFAQVKTEIDKAILDKRVAENKTLPALDAYAGFFSASAEGSNSDALDTVGSAEFGTWNVGLEWRYPLQNRTARYRFHQAEREVEARFVALQQTRDNVAFDVREAIRNVETNLQQIQVQSATVEFNKSKVDTVVKRQAVGLATSKDVLDFQRDLAQARIQLIGSIVNYNKAIIALEAAKGTLLYRLNVIADSGIVAPPDRIPSEHFGE